MDLLSFSKSYWDYYLELENRMKETRRYIEYDEYNFKAYSSNYLMLFQSVCSEIDVVGKEIAAYFNPDFDSETGNKPINRWWFEIQDNLPDVIREIVFADSYSLFPWEKYRVKKVVSTQIRGGKDVTITNYNLQDKTDGITFATPTWWNAYNKVKHKRLQIEGDELNYKKANQKNLASAFAALYLLEFEFMKKIGTVRERAKFEQSELFGLGDLQGIRIKNVIYKDREFVFE